MSDELVVVEEELLFASAVKFLIEGEEYESAGILLACRIESLSPDNSGYGGYGMTINLRGPRPAFEALRRDSGWDGSVSSQIRKAFEAVLPLDYTWVNLNARAEALTQVDPEWRQESMERAREKSVDNQGPPTGAFRLWNNLRFRSATEVKIAEALDRSKVLFFPLCRGRLDQGKARVTREPDFLVCSHGKWGIIEVDGEAFHPPSRTVHDHTRDRLFKAYGVKVVEHFDAEHCYNAPDTVVKKFLEILEGNG